MVILIIVIIVILVVSHNHHHNRNNRNNRSHNYNHHNYNHNNNIKMSSPWVENRMKKQEEKILKYGPLRWELKRQYPSFQVTQQHHYRRPRWLLEGRKLDSKEADEEVLRWMQKPIISNSALNISTL